MATMANGRVSPDPNITTFETVIVTEPLAVIGVLINQRNDTLHTILPWIVNSVIHKIILEQSEFC